VVVKTKMNEDLLEGLKRTETRSVVVLFSSGVESSATALMMKRQGYEVFPLFIDYGQAASEAELLRSKELCIKLGLHGLKVFSIVNLKDICRSNLLGEGAQDDSNAWVPMRNTLFMTFASMYAEGIGADGIALGYALEDNFVFGDNDYFHHKMAELLFSKSLLRPFQVFMPIKGMTKSELLRMLEEVECSSLTISCWNAKVIDGQVTVCGTCANCLERECSRK